MDIASAAAKDKNVGTVDIYFETVYTRTYDSKGNLTITSTTTFYAFNAATGEYESYELTTQEGLDAALDAFAQNGITVEQKCTMVLVVEEELIREVPCSEY